VTVAAPTAAPDGQPILAVRHLVKHFPVYGGILRRTVGHVHAVDDVSFEVYPGQTLGLVGESGCGKTTVGRTILRIIRPTSGEIAFDGRDLANVNGHEQKAFQRSAQMIFQDPFSSLDPRTTVGETIGEGLRIHAIGSRAQRAERVREIMDLVGLRPYYAQRYPHEFSGGQRQRIGIARALVLRPKLVVCDEPVSALDVSIQSQILNLLKDLQRQLALTYLFIAHNLAVVRYISDRVGVMYLGKLVEVAPTEELFANALHPYTQALLSAIPIADPAQRDSGRRIVLAGDVPSPICPPSGCRFHTRCPFAIEVCRMIEPPLKQYGSGHAAACHVVEETYKPPATTG
jgi:oligopeptide/dipeptide ABC transporter ATP-binding protein